MKEVGTSGKKGGEERMKEKGGEQGKGQGQVERLEGRKETERSDTVKVRTSKRARRGWVYGQPSC
jgi:hypothetical protein